MFSGKRVVTIVGHSFPIPSTYKFERRQSQWVQKQQRFKSFLTSHLSHQGKNISVLLQPLVKVFSSLPGISVFTGRHIYPGFQNDPLREREERK